MVSPKSLTLTVKQNQSPNSVSLISTASVDEQLRRNSPTMRQSLTSSCSSPHSSKQTPTKDGDSLFPTVFGVHSSQSIVQTSQDCGR